MNHPRTRIIGTNLGSICYGNILQFLCETIMHTCGPSTFFLPLLGNLIKTGQYFIIQFENLQNWKFKRAQPCFSTTNVKLSLHESWKLSLESSNLLFAQESQHLLPGNEISAESLSPPSFKAVNKSCVWALPWVVNWCRLYSCVTTEFRMSGLEFHV